MYGSDDIKRISIKGAKCDNGCFLVERTKRELKASGNFSGTGATTTGKINSKQLARLRKEARH